MTDPLGTPLYAWQGDALRRWRAAGHRGIVEAVTGTGKTRVGIEAIREALDCGERCLVLVPTRELQRQWFGELRKSLDGWVRIGMRGDGHSDDLRYFEVVISVVNSAREAELRARSEVLVVADECHRYASDRNAKALSSSYVKRLGLTATLERPDKREEDLVEYFGPVCFRIGYERALGDDVVAHFSVALIGVRMTVQEAIAYRDLTERIGEFFRILVERYGLVSEPFHRFMRRVTELSESPLTPGFETARGFLSTISERRQLIANAEGKRAAVSLLAPAMHVANRTLVFTESIDMAESLADDLQGERLRTATVHSELSSNERRRVLTSFKRGIVDVVLAPRVLDEGIDVPEADLAVIVSASRTRRQMIQRMGRVLRRKVDGRLARFAVVYLEGTTEDPACGAHEAFLSEITGVADDLEVFPIASASQANEFLAITRPVVVPGPPRLVGDPNRSLIRVLDDPGERAEDVLGIASPPL